MNEEKKTKILIEIIGWTGSILVITAYILNSFNYITSQNIIYSILNLLGAILLGIRVFVNKNWSNLFLNIFWALIALFSIYFFFTSEIKAASLSNCSDEYQPVCGSIDGKRRTYTNSCSANFNGAKILYSGKCIVSTCPTNYDPVCAKKYGRSRTYSNSCQAKWHGAEISYEGQCVFYTCEGKQDKVCAEKNEEQQTYQDYCQAMNDQAEVLYKGECQIERTITNCPQIAPPNFDCLGSIIPVRDEDGCTTSFECIKNEKTEIRSVDKAPECEVVGEEIDFLYRKKISYGRFLTIKNNFSGSDLFFETNGQRAYLKEKYRDLIFTSKDIIFLGRTPILIFPDDVLTKAAAVLKLDPLTPSQTNLTFNNNQAVYEVSFTTTGRIFGFIKKNIKIAVFINPQTGQIIDTNEPWYIF